jgi:hypothetical protein
VLISVCACACVSLTCRLQPGVEKVARAAADPELRDVAANAIAILDKVNKEGEEAAALPEAAKAEPQVRGGEEDTGEGGRPPWSSRARGSLY